MASIRISVTDIDQYRYYRQSEGMELSALLSRLRKDGPPSKAMRVGIALHSALENSTAGDYASLSADGYSFTCDENIGIALPGRREEKRTKLYHVRGHEVTLVGKVDCVTDRRVTDHKTTSRYDPEKLWDGYQWRFYLDMWGVHEFQWNVFVLAGVDSEYTIKEYHELTQYRYPDIVADCAQALAEFVEFAEEHLPERFTSIPGSVQVAA